MNIKEHIMQRRGEKQYPERWTKLDVRLDQSEKPTDIPSGFGVLCEYKTTLSLTIISRCNDAQWNGGRKKEAIDRLCYELFKEPVMHIKRAVSAVYGQDEEEILSCLEEALESMGQ